MKILKWALTIVVALAAIRLVGGLPPSGAGAAWEWKSRTQGDGKMTFTAAEPGQRVAYDLGKDFDEGLAQLKALAEQP